MVVYDHFVSARYGAVLRGVSRWPSASWPSLGAVGRGRPGLVTVVYDQYALVLPAQARFPMVAECLRVSSGLAKPSLGLVRCGGFCLGRVA